MEPFYTGIIIIYTFILAAYLVDSCSGKLEESEKSNIQEDLTDSGSVESSDSVTIYENKKYRYRHHLWPSPRPVNLVRNISKHAEVEISGRLTHSIAIEFLAYWANISVDELLEINPIIYVKDYMPWHGSGDSFKRSIPDLERFINT